MHTETPMYEGGMSGEIEFQEVVSNSATADEPLGTLAGRGINTSKKGGKLHIKVTEPCYIMGIVSITPRVDYCQGNDFDMYFKTLPDCVMVKSGSTQFEINSQTNSYFQNTLGKIKEKANLKKRRVRTSSKNIPK